MAIIKIIKNRAKGFYFQDEETYTIKNYKAICKFCEKEILGFSHPLKINTKWNSVKIITSCCKKEIRINIEEQTI